MTVTVHMHGNLRRFMPEGRDRLAIELEAGTTIETLLRHVVGRRQRRDL